MKVNENATWFIAIGFILIFTAGQICTIFDGGNGEEENGFETEQEDEREEGEENEEDD